MNALELADALENEHDPWPRLPAAAELRRLHAENERIRPLAERVLELKAQRDALLEALQALYDEQQGPPLIRHQAAWEAAMEMARAAIKAVEENK